MKTKKKQKKKTIKSNKKAGDQRKIPHPIDWRGGGDEVEQHDALEKKYRKKLEKRLTNVIEELPTFLEKLVAIMEDQNQTSEHMFAKLDALVAARLQVYNVLNFALKQVTVQPYSNRNRPSPQPQRSPQHGPDGRDPCTPRGIGRMEKLYEYEQYGGLKS
ncbi:unnamed protein product [Haemonchus placei]|uniref:DUF148 domain-containing protein n=1 Tax=Haemonchus placei TaxID=6290 RepID=A0A0N4WEY1_HAEPC|nr:unnamed protein product [Haemonchus placei]